MITSGCRVAAAAKIVIGTQQQRERDRGGIVKCKILQTFNQHLPQTSLVEIIVSKVFSASTSRHYRSLWIEKVPA
jgi:hypothetical protein